MVQFDNANRLIKVKIVYYGPAVGGKTTSLQHLHRVVDPEQRTRLYSLNTADDRTLFFDLMSLDLGHIRDYRLLLQVYTVPGQVQYEVTRRTVLAGADGVVFVADSQTARRQDNLESLADLRTNLGANGLDPARTPLVFAYNKRDLDPVLGLDALDAALNPDRLPAFPTVATVGEGVVESFVAIGELTLASLAERLGVAGNPEAVAGLQGRMARAMRRIATDVGREAATDVEVCHPERTPDDTGVFRDEDLVAEAVRTNLTTADLNNRLELLSRQLEHRVADMETIAEFGRALGNERDPAAVLRRLAGAAVRLLRVPAAAVLVSTGSGELREAVVHGLDADPLLHTRDSDRQDLAQSLLAARTPCLVTPEVNDSGVTAAQAAVEAAGYSSAVAVPLLAQDRAVGLLAAYRTEDEALLSAEDLQRASVLAATAAMAYANAVAWRQMEELSRGLEEQVGERTAELRATLAESRRLATDLSEKKALLEAAYRDLEESDDVKNQLLQRLALEFRTPVTSLATAARVLLRDQRLDDDKLQRLVTVIHDEAARLEELIESVFQAAVLGRGGTAPSVAPVPAQELIRRAIAPLRDLARERQVRIQVLVPSDLATVLCDAGSMEAALRAVIRNGIEFNRPGGEVRLEVRRSKRGSDSWLQLRVVDTGPGISEADLPHVCSPFWQREDDSVGKRFGVGLGLTIARRVIESHGGELSIGSADAGTGAKVVLALPQTPPTDAEPPTAQP